jgi:hypothetical protein
MRPTIILGTAIIGGVMAANNSTESWGRFKKRADTFELQRTEKPIDFYPMIIDTLEVSFLLLLSALVVVLIYRIWSDIK